MQGGKRLKILIGKKKKKKLTNFVELNGLSEFTKKVKHSQVVAEFSTDAHMQSFKEGATAQNSDKGEKWLQERTRLGGKGGMQPLGLGGGPRPVGRTRLRGRWRKMRYAEVPVGKVKIGPEGEKRRQPFLSGEGA